MIAPLLLALALSQPDSPFLRCTGVTDDVERLACFDRTAAMMTAGLAEEPVLSTVPEPQTVPAPAPSTTPAAALPPAPAPAASPEPEPRRRFGLRERRAEPESVTAAVAQMRLDRAGKLVVTLDDGQVWRQIGGDTTAVRLTGDPDDQTATIRRAALGSYRMRIEPLGKTVRVKRER